MRAWLEGGRAAWVLGGLFIAAGVVYWFFNYLSASTTDAAGAVLLVLTGVSMAFGLLILLRGSRDL